MRNQEFLPLKTSMQNLSAIGPVVSELLSVKKRHGRAGSGRFMTEMGLGGKKKHFFSLDHIPKMLRFGVMQLFQFSLTAAGGSLASSLRFASLRSQLGEKII